MTLMHLLIVFASLSSLLHRTNLLHRIRLSITTISRIIIITISSHLLINSISSSTLILSPYFKPHTILLLVLRLFLRVSES